MYIRRYVNDVLNSIALIILKYIYNLTEKALFVKQICNLYFCAALFFLFIFQITRVFFATFCNIYATCSTCI